MAASSRSSSGGSSPAELWRRVGDALGDGTGPPQLLEKVRSRAWQITDADVAGMSADELYEAVLPAAYAVADAKLRVALEAIDAH